MSYFEKVDVKDKVVETPNKIKLTDSFTEEVLGTYDYEKEEGTVTEAGTAQNKAFLQAMQDTLFDTLGDADDIDITLTPSSQSATTTAPIVSSPLDFTLTGETTVVGDDLVSSEHYLITTTNSGDTKDTELALPYVLGSVPTTADTIDCVDGKMVKTNNTNVGEDGATKVVIGTLSGYENGKGAAGLLSIAKITAYLTDALASTTDSAIGYDGTNVYKMVQFSSELTDEHGMFLQSDNDFYIMIPTADLSFDSLVGIQAYLDANPIQLIYQLATPTTQELPEVSTLMSFKDSATVTIEDGYIKGELANVKLSSTTYYINSISINDNTLDYLTAEISDITYDGQSIKSLGTITEDSDAYGVQRWEITQAVVEENNIDINKVYVTYTHLESNGETNLEGTFKNSLAKSHDSLAKSVSTTQNQVDENSKTIDKAMGILGAEKLQDFAVTVAGVATWDNPVGVTRVELFWGTKDISHYNYQQLVNEVTKVNAGTAETHTFTPLDPETDYYVVPVAIYTVGGKEYQGISNVSEFTTPNYYDYYEAPDNNAGFTNIGGDTTSFDTDGIELLLSGNHGSVGTATSQDLTSYTSIEFTLSKMETTGTVTGNFLLVVSSGATISGTILASTTIDPDSVLVKSLNISSITSGYIQIRDQVTGTQDLVNIKATRIRGNV